MIKQAALRVIVIICGAIEITTPAIAGTWVGNGDDGGDLEGFAPMKDAKILGARTQALELVKKLNVGGIRGMGSLTPELERSPLYMAKLDTESKIEADRGSSHTDIKGRVFARTLAEPHAATRFFPIALKLDEDQLVALHIHEALHRALPDSVRENEAIVSELTLAMVAPESSYDSVQVLADKRIPLDHPFTGSSVATQKVAPEKSRVSNPSTVSYEMRSYWHNSLNWTPYMVDRAHVLQSLLYPFGGGEHAFGLGIEASLITQPVSTIMGPLGLSGRMRAWSSREFDIDLWAKASLNTLSAEELKNSPFGRDLFTFGIELTKDLSVFYIDNLISVSTSGSAEQTIGRVNYRYDYGAVANAAVHAGVHLFHRVRFGAYAEIYLADYYRVQGGAFDGFDTGRYRMVSAGPEASVLIGNVSISGYGKFLLDAPEGVDFNTLGNLMGPGSGQTSVGGRVSYFF